ncbi:hypothetical protein [Haloarchaeobius sp. DFWS5]|uniref:hypothetical protein n=1 Tax=Haloarchaeobius sp. DFWS5 TaxID=3446114 RepID=UPI003EBC2EE4
MVAVEESPLCCAACGRTVFDGVAFFTSCGRSSEDGEAVAADVAADGVAAVADSRLLLTANPRLTQAVDGRDFVRAPRFVEEADRAFCSPECRAGYYDRR